MSERPSPRLQVIDDLIGRATRYRPPPKRTRAGPGRCGIGWDRRIRLRRTRIHSTRPIIWRPSRIVLRTSPVTD